MLQPMKKIFFLILSLFYFLPNSYGDDPIVFRNLTVKDGLSSHIVYAIESDDNDMIWSISPNGIDRFDGKNFKHYRLYKLDSVAAGHLGIKSGFFKDSDNVLWVYSQYGIYYYNKDFDRFDIFTRFQKQYNNNPSFQLIKELEDEIIFFAWSSAYIWNKKNKTLEQKAIDFRINSICDYPSQGILIGTSEGLKLFSNNGFQDFQLYGNSLKNAKITSLFRHPNGSIWIGTRHKGIYMIKNNRITQLSIGGPYTIMDISRYNGKVLVATDGKGLLFFDDEGNQDLKFDKEKSHLYGFGIYDIHIDKKNRLWLSTYGMGIYYYLPNKPIVQDFKKNLLDEIGANHGNTIFKDSFGRILLGTDNGLIVDANSDKPTILKISDFKENKNETSNFVINKIVEDDDNYWVSSYGHGLFVLDKKSLNVKKHITHIEIDNKQIPISFISGLSIFQGKIWIRLVKGELIIYDTSIDKSELFPLKSLTFIKEHKATNEMYFSNTLGLYSYSDNKSKLIFKSKSNITDFITINSQYTVFGTQTSGIKLYDYKNDTLYEFQCSKRLPSNIVQLINIENNEIIVLGDNAVYKLNINPEKHQVEDINVLLDRFEAIHSANIISDNKLILGGYEAFIDLPYLFKVKDQQNSKIILDDLEVEGKTVIAGQSDILSKRIDNVEKIELPYPYQDFRINLISPNYSGEVLYYSWKLKGYDNNYSDKTTYSVIAYNNLPYGEYTLDIKCYSEFQNKEIASRSININILPPYWKTIWAYALYFIAFVVLIIAIFNYVIGIKKQRSLKKRNQLYAEIAHEIRTPLSLVIGPLQKLEDEKGLGESGKKLLQGASLNLSRLNKRVGELLDFERVKTISDSLFIQEFDLISFINKLLTDFEPLLKQRNITIAKEFNIDKLFVKLDEDKLEKIIYNLISNAIKYSNNDDKIEIELLAIDNSWSLTVNDNGMGIPKKNQKHIFNRFYRADNAIKSGIIGSGIGLILSYKYAKMMEGSLSFESSENIGTSFMLKLPIEIIDEESHIPEDVSHYGDEFNKLSDKKYDYKIAVAEDNDELREFLKEALSENFKVDVFRNGKDCYDGLISDDYDLVLSDIMMPEMNGYELCDKIKGNIETSHLPIILLTALNASMYKAEGYEHGADHYIIKPFDIRMLKFRIINLVKNRLAIKKLYQQTIITGEALGKIDTPKKSIDSIFLEKLDSLVMNNISNHEYGVQNICSDLAMSRPVLYRKLKALTDFSPKEYIQNKRLNLAKHLLETSEDSIGNVAYESGYSDPKYFSTAFKKKYGVSPSDYMKQFNK